MKLKNADWDEPQAEMNNEAPEIRNIEIEELKIGTADDQTTVYAGGFGEEKEEVAFTATPQPATNKQKNNPNWVPQYGYRKLRRKTRKNNDNDH